MADKVVKVKAIQQRRDTDANWKAKNPILLDGEQITVVFDGNITRHKTGYGGKRYNELPFDKNINLYAKTFDASDWENGTITIPVSEHKQELNEGVVLSKIYMLSDGVYTDQCLATMDTTLSVSTDKSVVLSYSGTGYAGKVILYG